MGDLLRLFFIGTAAVALQWLFFGRLDLWGATPDVVLLFVLWVAVRYGQTSGTIAGFLVGFALDAIYGMWGIHMFVKTVIGFLVGLLNMINSEVFVRSARRVVETTLVISLVHNSLLALFVVMQRGVGWGYLLWVLCIGSTLYTTLVAFLAVTFWRR
ncbi:MAG: rod shape-determining protein MreD [Bacteroidetes bacterium]|nr:rod shape-determining protein MreD [Bacteroidota bacterium]